MKKIWLTGKRGIGKFALVDDEDFERCFSKKWSVNHLGRPKGMYKIGLEWKKVFMHRFILGFPDGQIDHINRNILDNRKSNLRVCTNAQNQVNNPPRNGKKYKGIRMSGAKWEARIKVSQKDIYLGLFEKKIDAASAYNEAAVKYFGEFAWLNTIK